MRTRRSQAGIRTLCLLLTVLPALLFAQELAPRAYLITPTGSNAITLSSSVSSGALNLPGELPLQDASGTFTVQTITYYRSFNLLGRSANMVIGLPYGIGNFEGTMESGNVRQAYRSGLLDTGLRFAVNLKGGPAMPLTDFVQWKQGMLLGVSLRVVPPTGQYIPGRLINWSVNRWGFKPEFGYSQRWGKWILDGYAGVWLFTANPQAFAAPQPKYQTLSPILSLEGHLSYDVKRRLWFSLDGNFWTGGTATLDGIPNPDSKQTSARIGGTASLPLNQRQSLKISYSRGAYVRFGGDYQNFTLAWQYAWLSKPRVSSSRRDPKPPSSPLSM